MSDDIVKPVRKDLRRILLLTPGIPPVIKWEGRAPIGNVAGVERLDEKLELVATKTETYGTYGLKRREYVYHLNLFYPSTRSLSDLESFADKLCNVFWTDRAIGENGVVGKVTNQRVLRLVENDGNNELPVRIDFYVRYLTRPLIE